MFKKFFVVTAFSFLLLLGVTTSAHASWTLAQDDPSSGVMWQSSTNYCLYQYSGNYYAGASTNCLSYDWTGTAVHDFTAITSAFSADHGALPSATNATSGGFEWPCSWSQFSTACSSNTITTFTFVDRSTVSTSTDFLSSFLQTSTGGLWPIIILIVGISLVFWTITKIIETFLLLGNNRRKG